MNLENLPKPFNGRILIEAIQESVDEHLSKLAKLHEAKTLSSLGFKIVAAETSIDERTGEKKTTMKQGLRTPIKRGKIVKMAPDAFGEQYMERRGGLDIGVLPTYGDVIWFIPNETYQIDQDGVYHFINDDQIVAIDEKTEEEKVNE